MTCTHTQVKHTWVDEDNDGWNAATPGHWEREEMPTTQDLDLSRYQCTQCGEVMYYTGLWREYHEKGVVCAGSESVKRVKP